MGEEQQVASVKIREKSVFKIKDLYDFYYNLIQSLGFTISEDSFVRQKGLTAFEWSCVNWVDDYIQYKIWTKTKVIGAKDVKVKREGVAEQMSKATVEVAIKGKIVTDWQNRWGSNPITKFLKSIFDKYLLRSSFESRKRELREQVFLLENELKSFFELPRFM